ncbi:hypothetical protein E1A91_D13G057500v1 [Gossypium mustelinum]|uniref:Uncharacterized protein n=1 Tax=Gossypium mustelinum TaxID=34275 RepID=A0A5D2S257_GOSMU|nr:hypothetical protein E1A91_D13G057500v1 [Gossypium mustelinum]
MVANGGPNTEVWWLLSACVCGEEARDVRCLEPRWRRGCCGAEAKKG